MDEQFVEGPTFSTEPNDYFDQNDQGFKDWLNIARQLQNKHTIETVDTDFFV